MVENCVTKAAAKDFDHLASFNYTMKKFMRFKDSVDFSLDTVISNFKSFLAKFITHLQLVETFFSESFKSFPQQLLLYMETMVGMVWTRVVHFLSLIPIDSWQVFSLYQQLNTFFVSSRLLGKSRFHKQLCEAFAPVVIRYMNATESSIAASYTKNIAQEDW